MNKKEAASQKLNSAVIIPALNPVPELAGLVRELLNRGIPKVIVVNDGSGSTYGSIFKEIEKLENCIVLVHKINRGKGRALKTAFSYFLKHFPDLSGVVTADADGQHSADDICNICGILSNVQNSIVLGVRNFREKNVPKRSYIGNTVTSHIFRLLYGSRLHDTQTGLRGIPSPELSWMVEIAGERYDFEINMLIRARHRKLGFKTVPIKTLYFNNNSGSHYNTIKDSFRILKILISGKVGRYRLINF